MPAPLPSPARRLIVAVVLLAGVAVPLALVDVARRVPGDLEFGSWVALLAVLYLVADSGYARAASSSTSIALGSVVVLAAVALVGTAGAVLVAAMSFPAGKRSAALQKRLFNAGQIVLSAVAAGVVYRAVAVQLLGAREIEDNWPEVLTGVIAADVTFCLVNGLLVASIVSLAERVPMRAVWQGTFSRQIVPYLGYGLFGALLVILWADVGIGPMAALLLLLPLFVARWAYAQYAAQEEAYDRTVRALVQAVETKDYYTRGHSERVSRGSVMIARVLGLREDRVEAVRYAGILHDIGKLGVPTRLLSKSGRLTEAEFAAVRMHPMRGVEMVSEIAFLDDAIVGIRHHHERFDGGGYPMGLRGRDIPEFARMIAVVDAFDSMTSTRSYRGARPVDDAVEELRRCAGTQFDPDMVEAFATALDREGWSLPPQEEPPAGTPSASGFDHDDPALGLPFRGGGTA